MCKKKGARLRTLPNLRTKISRNLWALPNFFAQQVGAPTALSEDAKKLTPFFSLEFGPASPVPGPITGEC